MHIRIERRGGIRESHSKLWLIELNEGSIWALGHEAHPAKIALSKRSWICPDVTQKQKQILTITCHLHQID